MPSGLHASLLVYTDHLTGVLWITINKMVLPSSEDVKKITNQGKM